MTVLEVLTAVKDIVTDIDATPQPALVAVHVRPSSDDEPIDLSAFPVAIVQQAVMLQPTRIRRITMADYERTWLLEVLFLLGEIRLPDHAIEEMARDWYPAIEAAVLSNPYLNGTVERWGSGDDGGEIGFTMRTGHCHFYHEAGREPDAYWGIEVQIPVTTRHEFEEQEYIPPDDEEEPGEDEDNGETEP